VNKRLIVIGGGAAGFFCAVNAARLDPRLKVTIIEKTNKLLSKVKVSGGGRCNVAHACYDIDEMSKQYPRGQNFVKKSFHQFFTTDTINWFEERGVMLKTEDDGRMFPETDSSQTIIDY
jgi:predicted Rossmann fold flavoprotein